MQCKSSGFESERPLRVLIAHNRYQQRGGEDAVVEREAAMLAGRGHTVELLAYDNDAIDSPVARVQAAVHFFYSRPAYRHTTAVLKCFQPDILHVHNFLPSLSPAVFFAANAANIPVVQTLHNYRLLCANALLFREEAPCQDCLDRHSFLPAIRHACYRDSRVGSAVVGAGMAIHGALGTWTHRVDRYIALTQFAAHKFAGAQLPEARVAVKPNFVPDLGVGSGLGNFALFVGRLSKEKGLQTLIAADSLDLLPISVCIAGDGPWMPKLQEASSRAGSRLVVLGHQTPQQVQELMKSARVLLVPSLFYEGFPLVMVEALAVGCPIIASRIGGLPEIAEENVSAFFHKPGDPHDLQRALQRLAHEPHKAVAMRAAARRRYLERYTEAANYKLLYAIYQGMLTQVDSLGMGGRGTRRDASCSAVATAS